MQPTTPPGPLAGRNVLVTGGARGIGRAVVERLAGDGAAVAFSYLHSLAQAKQLAADLSGAGSRVHALQADLARLADVRSLFEQAETLLGGGIDILINNAGQTLVAPIAETAEEDYDRLMAVNAKATFFAMQQAAHRLRDGGRVINISTANTRMRVPGIAVYAATKAAVEQFTLVASRELAIRKITVNTVSPGPVDTDMLRSSQSRQALDMAAAMTPLRRLGEPADIADVIAFLAGPGARWVTGQNIVAAGGLA
jgi:3-oxoacyl-[acyl-carrier protein] reductase